ncbi:hypothetical protein HOE04_00940 [archaeon]|jgi:thioredoxin 1|nr:hypothetical protein [archaeon]
MVGKKFVWLLMLLLVVGGVLGADLSDTSGEEYDKWAVQMRVSFNNIGTTEWDIKDVNARWSSASENNFREKFIAELEKPDEGDFERYNDIRKLWNILEEDNKQSMFDVLDEKQKVGLWNAFKYTNSGFPLKPELGKTETDRKELLEYFKGEENNEMRNKFLSDVFGKIRGDKEGSKLSVLNFPDNLDYNIDENGEVFIVPAFEGEGGAEGKEARNIRPAKIPGKVDEIEINKANSLVYTLGQGVELGEGDEKNWVVLQKKGVLEIDENGRIVVREYSLDEKDGDREPVVRFNKDKNAAVLFGKPKDLNLEKDVLFKDENGVDRILEKGNHQFKDNQWMWGDVEIQVGERVASPDSDDETSRPRYYEGESVVEEKEHAGFVNVEGPNQFGLRGVMNTGVNDGDGEVQENKGLEIKIKETNDGGVIFGSEGKDKEGYIRVREANAEESKRDDLDVNSVIVSGKSAYAEIISRKGNVARIDDSGKVKVGEGDSLLIIEEKSYVGNNGEFASYKIEGAVRVGPDFTANGDGGVSGDVENEGPVTEEDIKELADRIGRLTESIGELAEGETLDGKESPKPPQPLDDCGPGGCCPDGDCDDKEVIKDLRKGSLDFLGGGEILSSYSQEFYGSEGNNKPGIKIVGNKNNLAKPDKVIALKFGADWCPGCVEMTPFVEGLAKEGHTFATINTDVQKSLTAKYKIDSLPTIVFLKNGVEVDRSGYLSQSALKQKFNGL